MDDFHVMLIEATGYVFGEEFVVNVKLSVFWDAVERVLTKSRKEKR